MSLLSSQLLTEGNQEVVEHSNQTNDALQPLTSFRVLFCRLFWLFGGPVILAFLTIKMWNTKDGWGAASDLGFPIILVGTVAARWICYRAGDRSNTMGQVTKIEELRRYSIMFLTGGALVWLAANIVGNLVSR